MRGPKATYPFFSLILLLAAGCQPKIGDKCVTDLDCSQQGDRLCDTTQRAGYCTQVDCDPLSCPEKESICVAFNSTVSTQGACNIKGQTSPYRRAFCMAVCEGSGDCRSGYACVDMAKANDWGAEVIQDSPEETTVCVEAMSHPPLDEEQGDQVCTGISDADFGAGGAGGAPAE
jgi:hypothetical protein